MVRFLPMVGMTDAPEGGGVGECKRTVRFLPLVGMTDAAEGGCGVWDAAAKPLHPTHLLFQCHMSFRPRGGIFQYKLNQPGKEW